MMSSSQVCEFHMRGRCRYGNKCRKSHHLEFSWNQEYFDPEAPIPEPLFAQTNPRRYRSHTTVGEIVAQLQAHKRKTELEEAMRLSQILRLPDHAILPMRKKEVKEIAVAEKTGNGNSVEENASNLNVLDQKKMKGKTENDGAAWNSIILSAIDSDLLCNICFEIFIKPIVINCSHTFCEACIHVWTLRVRNCPICREEVKSKSYCLTLESFIGKIVEHLPVEMKNKREAAIKEREVIKIQRPQQGNHSFGSSAYSGFMYMDRQVETTTQPPQYQGVGNIGFNTDADINESEMSRMYLHDTAVNTRGIDPLRSYIRVPEEQTLNRNRREPRNRSARH